MGRRRSNKTKAEREVDRRAEYFKMRRFNDPLRCFVERKYPKIFAEYTEFYHHLNILNPKRKNLAKSKHFKDWLKDNSTLIPLKPELEVELMPLELANINMRLRKAGLSLQVVMNEGEAITNETEADTSEVTSEVEVVVNEGEANEGEASNLQGVEPTLQSLVDELLEDNVWQELLNQDLSGVYTHIETNGGF